MKDSIKVLSAFALMAVLGTMGFSAIASAAEADDTTEDDEIFAKCQAYMEEHRMQHQGERPEMDAIKAAVEDGDYSTWYELHQNMDHPGNGQMLETITEENFSLLGDMMDARESGDFETAKEIRDELGLEHGFGHGAHNGLDRK
jgi:hypothetical protein